jgi:hypothetical protein
VAIDNGKHVSITSSVAGIIVTVPANIFSTGDNVVIYNNGTNSISINPAAGVTLRYAGSNLTGNRSLAGYGVATLLCVTGGANPVFVISGAGLV